MKSKPARICKKIKQSQPTQAVPCSPGKPTQATTTAAAGSPRAWQLHVISNPSTGQQPGAAVTQQGLLLVLRQNNKRDCST